jgi:hypothetical protein
MEAISLLKSSQRIRRPSRSLDTEEPAGQDTWAAKGIIDALRLAFEIQVKRANDDAGMRGVLRMKPDEVSSIERRDGAAISGCDLKDRVVGQRLMCFTDVAQGHHVVPKAA